MVGCGEVALVMGRVVGRGMGQWWLIGRGAVVAVDGGEERERGGFQR